MQNLKPTPGQVESLVKAIGRTGNIKDDFQDFDTSAYSLLSNISFPQYQLLKQFVIGNKIFKLKLFLTGKGLKIREKKLDNLDF